MKKKVIMTAGGTGGHIFPAMALAKQLIHMNGNVEAIFAAGGLKTNPYFSREEFTFHEVASGTLSLKKPFKSLKNIGSICRGIIQSYCLLRKISPDLVVGFGSYHTLPILLAAKLLSIPIVLHEFNSIPGKVNQLMSSSAVFTGVHFPGTVNLLKGKAIQVTTPLREGYRLGMISKQEAREYFQLDPLLTTVLIFGGSQGAQRINSLMMAAANLLKGNPLQFLHITGNEASAKQIHEEYVAKEIHATVKAFVSRMDIAWQSADLVISRSGASALAEELEFEVPGILIPYPQATDNHQENNANFMVHSIKGAIMCLERELSAEKLAFEIESLLKNQCQKLMDMKQSMRNYKHQQALSDFGIVIMNLMTSAKGINND